MTQLDEMDLVDAVFVLSNSEQFQNLLGQVAQQIPTCIVRCSATLERKDSLSQKAHPILQVLEECPLASVQMLQS